MQLSRASQKLCQMHVKFNFGTLNRKLKLGICKLIA